MTNLNFKVARIGAGSTCEELIESLKEITDADYNGDNGSDYFTHDSHLCDLECKVKALYNKVSTTELINAVIEDNYSNPYYANYEYHIEDSIDDYYLVVLASIDH